MTAAITDFTQYAGLRLAAGQQDPAALREVAGQFEALFVQSLLKNMREASLGDPLFGNSDQHDMYQEMLDQQLAVEMSSGKGLGLADMLVRQLGGDATPAPSGSNDLGRSVIAGSVLASRPAAAPATAASPNPTVTTVSVQPLSRSGTLADVAAKPPAWSDARSFAAEVWPHAERAAAKLNVAPEAILAQVVLETGWGAHVPQAPDGNSSYNLFGIKASSGWSGDSVARPTLEFRAGVPRLEVHRFRAYDDIGATFDDYSELLSQNPRYESVSNHGDDVDGFANALQSSGYATDPSYADKIRSVLRSETMQSILGSLKNLAARPILTTGGRLAAGSD